MQMQFHALEFALVFSSFERDEADVVGIEHELACNLGGLGYALHEQMVALCLRFFKLRNDLCQLFGRIEQQRTIDGVRSVGNGNIQRVAGLIFFTFVLKGVSLGNRDNRAFDNDLILAFHNVPDAPFQRGSDIRANEHALADDRFGLDGCGCALRRRRGGFTCGSTGSSGWCFRLVGLLREPYDPYACAAGLLFQRAGEFLRNRDGKLPFATKKDRQQVLLTVQRPMIQRYGHIVNADAPQR